MLRTFRATFPFILGDAPDIIISRDRHRASALNADFRCLGAGRPLWTTAADFRAKKLSVNTCGFQVLTPYFSLLLLVTIRHRVDVDLYRRNDER